VEDTNVDDLSERLLQSRFGRRPMLIGGLALLAAPGLALAQDSKAGDGDLTAELMKPGSVPDLVLGKADAPVTIVEYASMTCSHCATFHNKVLPKLKEKYIDSGKVRLILREFPLDNLAAAGAMLARCAEGDKSYAVIAALFAKQEEWAFVQGNPVPALFKLMGEHGFTKESFDKCLTDQKLLEGITGVRDHANKSLKVSSTPTFFINGRKLTDRSDQIESFDRAIEPLLKN
jgi:protein-disulfide isomerase